MRRLAGMTAVIWMGGAAGPALATDAGMALSLMGSARQAALGGGAVAASPGHDGLGANPAGLAAATRPAVGGTWLRGDLGLSVGRLGAVLPGALATVGVVLGGMTAGTVEMVDAAGAARTVDAQQDLTASAGIARALGRGVAVGVSAGWYRSALADAWRSTAMAADIGMRWSSAAGRIALGAAWLNAGGRLRYADQRTALPSRGTVGMAWRVVDGRRTGLLLAADMMYRPDGRRGMGIGAEFDVAHRLQIRAGVRRDDAAVVRSAGVGLRLGRLGLDLAVVAMGEATLAPRASVEVGL